MGELEIFAKLPQLDADCKKTNIGFIPTLSLLNNMSNSYIVYWTLVGISDVLNLNFIADTPEKAIKNAYKWCKENDLI